ncbi:cytochrome P450 [Dacryopinax primogenitus]|uniref:Cytochrome P450 n=1 Tax=Dacryopinax primogenitus (strain DJM 731) TaxID=1858805 RepID=M5FSG5_DACPD|nr:cytochrome P450 [Dacryopinax primogenitus]EJU00371.1 cytochrome P450 [Dacryopinax primogenitus]
MFVATFSPSWIALAAVALALVVYWTCTARRIHYPPGPQGKWFIGNLHDVPKEQQWRTYAAWKGIYGPIIHLNFLGGTHVVVLNDVKTVTDLLEKRANIYSDRPMTTMNTKLVNRQRSPFFVPFADPRFRIYRKMLHDTLGSRPMRDIWPVQQEEVKIFLGNLLASPEQFEAHIRSNAASVIMKIAYGYKIKARDDPFVAAVEEAFINGYIITTPGRWLVDSFPILRFLPEWFPGANFKKKARYYREQMHGAYQGPLDWVKAQMAAGVAISSFVSRQLASKGEQASDDHYEDILLNVAGSMFVGAADTTVSAMISFFYIMTTHPEVQRRAQAEIFTAVGADRLPTMEDRGSLPYVNCVLKEIFRWCPPGPLSLPHSLTQDDVYNGYGIPAGTVVQANIWALMHDETMYPDPLVFDPDRFSGVGGRTVQQDPTRWVWGFGRRVCPGQHLAEAMLYISIACTLTLFNIGMAIDVQGEMIEPLLEFTTGTTSRVKSFRCSIVPRAGYESLLFQFTVYGDSSV